MGSVREHETGGLCILTAILAYCKPIVWIGGRIIVDNDSRSENIASRTLNLVFYRAVDQLWTLLGYGVTETTSEFEEMAGGGR